MKHKDNNQKFNLLLNFIHQIASEHPKFSEMIVKMADLGKQIINADRCSIWIIEEDCYWTKVSTGISGEIRISPNTGIVGKVVNTKKPYFTNNAYDDPDFNREVDKSTGYVTKSILAIPLFNQQNEVFGVYQIVNKNSDEEIDYFTDEDVKILQMVSQYTEQTLLNSMLTNEIKETQEEIIFLLADAIEHRSVETGSHIKRVAEMCGFMGKLMNFSSSDVELLQISSTLHDVGKIGIPDSILHKPGRFVDNEYEIMKTHTTIGYNMLSKSKRVLLKIAGTIAHEHHERYDGMGYPNRKKGEEIHIFSRIVSVLDVFDALYNPRCYKPAWDLESIIKLMKEEKGKQFDPYIIDLFLENIDEFLKIQETIKD